MGLTIGVDIGGTFTDVVCVDEASGALTALKVPSTPQDLVRGFLEGVSRALDGRPAREVARLAHGTTVATNALLERKGARLGVIATQGFEDVLFIGRQKRSEMYNLYLGPETPVFLAPRHRIRGVRERMGPEGRPLEPLDPESVARALHWLVEVQGCTSLAVCLLFSFVNPEHERRVRDMALARYPGLAVSISSEVDPRFREYERLVLTAFDAYIRPVVERYIRSLEGEMARLGVPVPLHLMKSSGGLVPARRAVARAVDTVMSGPAAGVIAGAYFGRLAGFQDLVTVDIGGTSCDVALVRGGRPLVSSEGHFERYPLRLPMVDVQSVGAGGGSIAWRPHGAGLRVGPQSAGAEPGPACYGRGGTQPTVTDASLVLGYLDPGMFAGGALALNPSLARRALLQGVARPLGMSLEESAWGVHRIINAVMADRLRLVSVRRGYDPRGLALVAFGGAGPVHAGRLARGVGIRRVVVPPSPGVLSALGLLLADLEHQEVQALHGRLDSLEPEAVEGAFRRMEGVARARLVADGARPQGVALRRLAEMRYLGQSYELEVELPPGPFNPQEAGGLFHRAHELAYGHADPASPVEVVNLRVVATFSPRRWTPPELPPARHPLTPRARRPAYFEDYRAYRETPVYHRDDLAPGHQLEGPAIVQQADTTTVLYPGDRASVDRFGNLMVEVGP